MRTSAQMIDKYNARYDAAAQLAARTAVADLAKANFAEYAVDWELYGNGIRAYLDAQAIPPVNYFGYFGFGNEMYALLSVAGGLSYDIEGNILIGKYVAFGLSQAILEGLASAVFPWTPPVA